MEKDYSFLDHAPRGMYFEKKEYDGKPLFSFDEVKDKLPTPILDAHPEWVECYRYAVSVLFRNTHRPTPQSGFVSNFVDAAFNKDIFLWDTCFMTFFCNLFHPYIPGICSLDNFYCKQFDDGEIPREMVRETGKDLLLWVNAYDKPLYSYFHKKYGFRKLWENQNLTYEDAYVPELGRTPSRHPYLTLDNLNHPILAMAEWESYRHTGDLERLQKVFEPLYRNYEALYDHLRHASNLYVTDWASMDNSPRNRYLGCGVDISSEMVLFANNLLRILEAVQAAGYEVVDADARRAFLIETSAATAKAIGDIMWDKETGFFYDVDNQGQRAPVKTAAAFWTLAAEVADEQQQKSLAKWLEDPNTFNRVHRVPVLAADEEGYSPRGDYWAGSVWAPMNQMIVLGLERCGYHDLAKDIAMNDLAALNQVFRDTGTIWENYPPDEITAGDSDHPDMVGWSGIAPILFLMQYAVGLNMDQQGQRLEWHIDDEMISAGRVGCERYWFQGKTANFTAEKTPHGIRVSVTTDSSFPLTVYVGSRKVDKEITGTTQFDV